MKYLTCKCGSEWGFSEEEISPVTENGCPHCSDIERKKLNDRNTELCRKIFEEYILVHRVT